MESTFIVVGTHNRTHPFPFSLPPSSLFSFIPVVSFPALTASSFLLVSAVARAPTISALNSSPVVLDFKPSGPSTTLEIFSSLSKISRCSSAVLSVFPSESGTRRRICEVEVEGEEADMVGDNENRGLPR